MNASTTSTETASRAELFAGQTYIVWQSPHRIDFIAKKPRLLGAAAAEAAQIHGGRVVFTCPSYGVVRMPDGEEIQVWPK